MYLHYAAAVCGPLLKKVSFFNTFTSDKFSAIFKCDHHQKCCEATKIFDHPMSIQRQRPDLLSWLCCLHTYIIEQFW